MSKIYIPKGDIKANHTKEKQEVTEELLMKQFDDQAKLQDLLEVYFTANERGGGAS